MLQGKVRGKGVSRKVALATMSLVVRKVLMMLWRMCSVARKA